MAVNDLVDEKNIFTMVYDEEKGYKVVDLDALSKEIRSNNRKLKWTAMLIVEGHLAHTF